MFILPICDDVLVDTEPESVVDITPLVVTAVAVLEGIGRDGCAIKVLVEISGPSVLLKTGVERRVLSSVLGVV